MSLIEMPEPEVPKGPKEPFVSEQPYRKSPVDSERTPYRSLLPYIKGSSWTVDYYRQLLTKDEESAANSPTREAIYQQYQLIKGFELKVQSGLSPNFQEEEGAHEMTGTAVIYPTFIPNKNDTMIVDLFDGRVGVLNVTAVRQKNIFQDSTYEIDYEVLEFLTDRKAATIKGKVVKTTVFVRDFALNGQNPLVLEEEYEQIQTLRMAVSTLQKQYFWELYNQETMTIPVPKQEQGTYDSYLMRFIDYAFPIQERDSTRQLTRYIVEGDPAFTDKTFWDMLAESSDAFEAFIVKEFDTIGTRWLTNYPVINGIGFSKLRRILFPKGRDLNAAYLAGTSRRPDHKRLDSPYSRAEWDDMDLRYAVRRQILNGLGDVPPADLYVPLVHPVGIDDYYVLTEYFYSKATYGQSQLELQTRALIERRQLDIPTLVALFHDVPNWGPMERFYYIPLLAFLIRKAIGGF